MHDESEACCVKDALQGYIYIIPIIISHTVTVVSLSLSAYFISESEVSVKFGIGGTLIIVVPYLYMKHIQNIDFGMLICIM